MENTNEGSWSPEDRKNARSKVQEITDVLTTWLDSTDSRVSGLTEAFSAWLSPDRPDSPNGETEDCLATNIFVTSCRLLLQERSFASLAAINDLVQVLSRVRESGSHKPLLVSLVDKLLVLAKNPWGHPVLEAILTGKPSSMFEVLSYLCGEPLPLVWVRMEVLMAGPHPGYAINLLYWLLLMPQLQNEISLHTLQLQLLFANNQQEFDRKCLQTSCCRSLRILRDVTQSQTMSGFSVCLARTFIIQVLFQQKECCLQELVTLWLNQEKEVEGQEGSSLVDAIHTVIELSHSASQLLVLAQAVIDMKLDIGDRLCARMLSKALQMGRGALQEAEKVSCSFSITSSTRVLTGLCSAAQKLYKDQDSDIYKAAMVAEFSLQPSQQAMTFLHGVYVELGCAATLPSKCPIPVKKDTPRELTEVLQALNSVTNPLLDSSLPWSHLKGRCMARVRALRHRTSSMSSSASDSDQSTVSGTENGGQRKSPRPRTSSMSSSASDSDQSTVSGAANGGQRKSLRPRTSSMSSSASDSDQSTVSGAANGGQRKSLRPRTSSMSSSASDSDQSTVSGAANGGQRKSLRPRTSSMSSSASDSDQSMVSKTERRRKSLKVTWGDLTDIESPGGGSPLEGLMAEMDSTVECTQVQKNEVNQKLSTQNPENEVTQKKPTQNAENDVIQKKPVTQDQKNEVTQKNPPQNPENEVTQKKSTKNQKNEVIQKKPTLDQKNEVTKKKPTQDKENGVTKKKPTQNKENEVTKKKPTQGKENEVTKKKPTQDQENEVTKKNPTQDKENEVTESLEARCDPEQSTPIEEGDDLSESRETDNDEVDDYSFNISGITQVDHSFDSECEDHRKCKDHISLANSRTSPMERMRNASDDSDGELVIAETGSSISSSDSSGSIYVLLGDLSDSPGTESETLNTTDSDMDSSVPKGEVSDEQHSAAEVEPGVDSENIERGPTDEQRKAAVATESEAEKAAVATESPRKKAVEATESLLETVTTESLGKKALVATESPRKKPKVATESPGKKPAPATETEEADVALEKATVATESPRKKAVVATKSPRKKAVVATKSPRKKAVVATKSPRKKAIVAAESPRKKPAPAMEMKEADVAMESPLEKATVATESPRKKAVVASKSPRKKAVVATKSPRKKHAPATETEEADVATESPLEKATVATESPRKKAVVATESPRKTAVDASESQLEKSTVATESPRKKAVATESRMEKAVVSTESPSKKPALPTETIEATIATESQLETAPVAEPTEIASKSPAEFTESVSNTDDIAQTRQTAKVAETNQTKEATVAAVPTDVVKATEGTAMLKPQTSKKAAATPEPTIAEANADRSPEVMQLSDNIAGLRVQGSSKSTSPGDMKQTEKSSSPESLGSLGTESYLLANLPSIPDYSMEDINMQETVQLLDEVLTALACDLKPVDINSNNCNNNNNNNNKMAIVGELGSITDTQSVPTDGELANADSQICLVEDICEVIDVVTQEPSVTTASGEELPEVPETGALEDEGDALKKAASPVDVRSEQSSKPDKRDQLPVTPTGMRFHCKVCNAGFFSGRRYTSHEASCQKLSDTFDSPAVLKGEQKKKPSGDGPKTRLFQKETGEEAGSLESQNDEVTEGHTNMRRRSLSEEDSMNKSLDQAEEDSMNKSLDQAKTESQKLYEETQMSPPTCIPTGQKDQDTRERSVTKDDPTTQRLKTRERSTSNETVKCSMCDDVEPSCKQLLEHMRQHHSEAKHTIALLVASSLMPSSRSNSRDSSKEEATTKSMTKEPQFFKMQSKDGMIKTTKHTPPWRVKRWRGLTKGTRGKCCICQRTMDWGSLQKHVRFIHKKNLLDSDVFAEYRPGFPDSDDQPQDSQTVTDKDTSKESSSALMNGKTDSPCTPQAKPGHKDSSQARVPPNGKTPPRNNAPTTAQGSHTPRPANRKQTPGKVTDQDKDRTPSLPCVRRSPRKHGAKDDAEGNKPDKAPSGKKTAVETEAQGNSPTGKQKTGKPRSLMVLDGNKANRAGGTERMPKKKDLVVSAGKKTGKPGGLDRSGEDGTETTLMKPVPTTGKKTAKPKSGEKTKKEPSIPVGEKAKKPGLLGTVKHNKYATITGMKSPVSAGKKAVKPKSLVAKSKKLLGQTASLSTGKKKGKHGSLRTDKKELTYAKLSERPAMGKKVPSIQHTGKKPQTGELQRLLQAGTSTPVSGRKPEKPTTSAKKTKRPSSLDESVRSGKVQAKRSLSGSAKPGNREAGEQESAGTPRTGRKAKKVETAVSPGKKTGKPLKDGKEEGTQTGGSLKIHVPDKTQQMSPPSSEEPQPVDYGEEMSDSDDVNLLSDGAGGMSSDSEPRSPCGMVEDIGAGMDTGHRDEGVQTMEDSDGISAVTVHTSDMSGLSERSITDSDREEPLTEKNLATATDSPSAVVPNPDGYWCGACCRAVRSSLLSNHLHTHHYDSDMASWGSLMFCVYCRKIFPCTQELVQHQVHEHAYHDTQVELLFTPLQGAPRAQSYSIEIPQDSSTSGPEHDQVPSIEDKVARLASVLSSAFQCYKSDGKDPPASSTATSDPIAGAKDPQPDPIRSVSVVKPADVGTEQQRSIWNAASNFAPPRVNEAECPAEVPYSPSISSSGYYGSETTPSPRYVSTPEYATISAADMNREGTTCQAKHLMRKRTEDVGLRHMSSTVAQKTGPDHGSEPQKTDTVPQKTDTVPQKTDTVSQKTSTEPQKTEEVPQTTETVPRVTCTVPQKTETVPRVTCTVPQKTSTEPQNTGPESQMTGPEPQKIDTVPMVTCTVPQKTSTEPQNTGPESQVTCTVPQKTSTEPQKTDTVPTVTRTEPQKTDTVPMVTCTVPQKTSTEPQKTDTVPTGTEPQKADTEPPKTDAVPRETDQDPQKKWKIGPGATNLMVGLKAAAKLPTGDPGPKKLCSVTQRTDSEPQTTGGVPKATCSGQPQWTHPVPQPTGRKPKGMPKAGPKGRPKRTVSEKRKTGTKSWRTPRPVPWKMASAPQKTAAVPQKTCAVPGPGKTASETEPLTKPQYQVRVPLVYNPTATPKVVPINIDLVPSRADSDLMTEGTLTTKRTRRSSCICGDIDTMGCPTTKRAKLTIGLKAVEPAVVSTLPCEDVPQTNARALRKRSSNSSSGTSSPDSGRPHTKTSTPKSRTKKLGLAVKPSEGLQNSVEKSRIPISSFLSPITTSALPQSPSKSDISGEVRARKTKKIPTGPAAKQVGTQKSHGQKSTSTPKSRAKKLNQNSAAEIQATELNLEGEISQVDADSATAGISGEVPSASQQPKKCGRPRKKSRRPLKLPSTEAFAEHCQQLIIAASLKTGAEPGKEPSDSEPPVKRKRGRPPKNPPKTGASALVGKRECGAEPCGQTGAPLPTLTTSTSVAVPEEDVNSGSPSTTESPVETRRLSLATSPAGKMPEPDSTSETQDSSPTSVSTQTTPKVRRSSRRISARTSPNEAPVSAVSGSPQSPPTEVEKVALLTKTLEVKLQEVRAHRQALSSTSSPSLGTEEGPWRKGVGRPGPSEESSFVDEPTEEGYDSPEWMDNSSDLTWEIPQDVSTSSSPDSTSHTVSKKLKAKRKRGKQAKTTKTKHPTLRALLSTFDTSRVTTPSNELAMAIDEEGRVTKAPSLMELLVSPPPPNTKQICLAMPRTMSEQRPAVTVVKAEAAGLVADPDEQVEEQEEEQLPSTVHKRRSSQQHCAPSKSKKRRYSRCAVPCSISKRLEDALAARDGSTRTCGKDSGKKQAAKSRHECSDVKSTPKQTVKSPRKQTVKSTPKQTVKPTPKQTVKPTPKQTVKPAPTQTVKPAPKQPVKPAPIQTVKPTPKQTVKPSPKQTVKPTPKQTVKPAPKQTVKTSPKQTVKSTPKQTMQPVCSKKGVKPRKDKLPTGALARVKKNASQKGTDSKQKGVARKRSPDGSGKIPRGLPLGKTSPAKASSADIKVRSSLLEDIQAKAGPTV